MSDPLREANRIRLLAACLAGLGAMVLLGAPARGLDSSDPTRPPEVASTEAAAAEDQPVDGFELTALLVSEGRRIAIINGQRLREGDALGPARIDAIEGDRVRLFLDDEPLELELVPRRVKTERAPAPVASPAPAAPLPERPALEPLPEASAPQKEDSE